MKNVKIFSVIIIILSVVVLGIVAAKQLFNYLEAKASSAGRDANKNVASGTMNPSIPSVSPSVSPSASPEIVVAPSAPDSSVRTTSSVFAAPTSASGHDPSAQANASGSMTLDFGKVKWVAFIIGDGTNVRDLPSTEKPSKTLFKLSKGTKGTVIDRKNGWSQIKWDFNRKVGWTRDDLLVSGPDEVVRNLVNDQGQVSSASADAFQAAAKKAAELARTIKVAVAKPAPPSETVKGFVGDKLPAEGVITASPFARIRESPSRQAAEVGRVPKGVTVKIKSHKQMGRYAWFEVSFSNGKKDGWTREDNLKF